jgi:hypothetical protein
LVDSRTVGRDIVPRVQGAQYLGQYRQGRADASLWANRSDLMNARLLRDVARRGSSVGRLATTQTDTHPVRCAPEGWLFEGRTASDPLLAQHSGQSRAMGRNGFIWAGCGLAAFSPRSAKAANPNSSRSGSSAASPGRFTATISPPSNKPRIRLCVELAAEVRTWVSLRNQEPSLPSRVALEARAVLVRLHGAERLRRCGLFCP